MNDELEQFEPARPRRRRRHTGRRLLVAGVVFLVAGVGWSACVAALWSPTPEVLANDGLAIVGCSLASIVCYVIGLAALLAWKNRRR
jgi:predicted acyltransferase